MISRLRSNIVGSEKAKLTSAEVLGVELMVHHAITIINHQRAIEFADHLLDTFGSGTVSGQQLVSRFQQIRVHNWLPRCDVVVAEKSVKIANISHELKYHINSDITLDGSKPIVTGSPNKIARENITFMFANITTWGPLVQNHLFTAEVLNEYQIFGLVETHVPLSRDTEILAKARQHFHDAVSSPAMVYSDTGGTHGGEAIFSAKHVFSLPIDQDIIDLATSVNDEPKRWVAMEIRVTQVSILVITAYLWCWESLSVRNWRFYSKSLPSSIYLNFRLFSMLISISLQPRCGLRAGVSCIILAFWRLRSPPHATIPIRFLITVWFHPTCFPSYPLCLRWMSLGNLMLR